MRESDLEPVLRIEQASFGSPWTLDNFRQELLRNPWSVNRVVEVEGQVVAYLTAWFVAGDVAINNLAIDPAFRRRGLGRELVRWLLRHAATQKCHRITLEVRQSNLPAQALYAEFGFVEVGRRPNYYQRDGEDAILMELICTGKKGNET